MTAIDHKTILAATLSARIGRRVVLKGAAGTAFAASTGALARPVQAATGGHIRVASLGHIDTLDPHFTGFLSAIQVIKNIHNGLLKVTYDGKVVSFVPDLAKTWDLIDDKTHLFKLHEGVTFHDGTKCDADAVKFSLLRVKEGTPKSPHAWMLALLDTIETPDPLTVKLNFSKPYAFLPVALTGSTGRAGTIVSPAAVKKYGMDYGRNPVGTGPFKFVSWRENDRIEIEKNPHYFEKGLPKLDRATFVMIKEPSSAVAAMFAGQVDAMNDCPMQLVKQVKAFPRAKLYGQIEGNYTWVGMNVRKPPFDDMTLRQAVAACIDRETVLKQVYFGLAIQAYTPISPPMSHFYDPNIAESDRGQRFDLDKAKALRAKAKNQGEIQVNYIMSEGNAPTGTRVAQSVAPMLDAIGIKANLQLIEPAAWVQRRNAGDFDMIDAEWAADLDPDETLYPEFKTGGAWNFCGWSSARFDELCQQAQAVLNPDPRRKLYYEAEDILMREAPVAMLAHIPVYKVMSSKVEGFEYIPADLLNLHTVSLD